MIKNLTAITPVKSTSSSAEEILTYLDLLHPEGDEFPVAICCKLIKPIGERKMISQLFTDHSAAAEYAARQDETGEFRAIYVNLNRLRVGAVLEKGVPRKADIECLTNLLLDFDRRDDEDKTTNASEEELEEVAQLRHLAKEYLITEFGDFRTLDTFTGNGNALIARLPNLDTDRHAANIGQFLKTLASKFETQVPSAKIDTSVGNAARLTRLCGTWNRKNPETPGRPHRRAELLSDPTALRVSIEKSWLGITAGAEMANVKTERPVGLHLKDGVNFEEELTKSGLAFVTRSDRGNTCYDYHGIKAQGCLLKGGLHESNLNNRQCSTFVVTPDHIVYHQCFVDSCQRQEHKTRRALEALKMLHVLAPASAVIAYSDGWLALRFVDQYKNELRFVAASDQWYRWDGIRWKKDETREAFDLVHKFCAGLSTQAKNGKGNAALASTKTATAVEKLVKAHRDIVATSKQWDQNLWILNTPDGTIDLKTGEKIASRPEDYSTRCTSVGMGSNPRPAKWLKYLKETFGGNQVVINFMQRVCGCALTGVTWDHPLFFFYGPGGTGKNTFTYALSGILTNEEYYRELAVEALMATNHDRHPTDLAGLNGARLVIANETEEARAWSESKLKQITGGGAISAHFMRQDNIDFIPQFKLIVVGNRRPRFRSVGNDTKRRLHLIPFINIVAEKDKNVHLWDELKEEWPDILRWSVAGCLAWQKVGLNPPTEVQLATADYLESQDSFTHWREERCETDPRYFDPSVAASEKLDDGPEQNKLFPMLQSDLWESTQNLFHDWAQWAKDGNEFIGNVTTFGETLESRGFPAKKVKQVRGRAGLKLKFRPPYEDM